MTGLERAIDAAEAALPALQTFLLPGGSEAGARLHLARTVCRRAERRLVALAAQEEVPPVFLAYLNRLSDLLFVLARSANCPRGRPGGRVVTIESGSAAAGPRDRGGTP